MKQWMELKEYANRKGIRIIGDIPIYVSPDSSDAWACGPLFQFDEDHRPTAVAGCPPDAFAADGQLWGNPLYDWGYHEQTGFAWWKKRIAHCLKLYDVVRIDHFRGFDEYYSIPAGDVTARNGHWEKGPGIRLFEALKADLPVTRESIIAEDLGFLTPSVIRMVQDSGFPGMKVIEFAFDSRDTGSGYLPHAYIPNTVVYTGTHDNQTLRAWYGELTPEDRRLADDYLGFTDRTLPEERNRAFIRLAMESVSDTCVIPIQDYLCLGEEARMNHPSTQGGNWRWRLTEGQIGVDLIGWVRRITRITGRGR
jgi:4-alpha-glucanotransferase